MSFSEKILTALSIKKYLHLNYQFKCKLPPSLSAWCLRWVQKAEIFINKISNNTKKTMQQLWTFTSVARTDLSSFVFVSWWEGGDGDLWGHSPASSHCGAQSRVKSGAEEAFHCKQQILHNKGEGRGVYGVICNIVRLLSASRAAQDHDWLNGRNGSISKYVSQDPNNNCLNGYCQNVHRPCEWQTRAVNLI